MPHEQTRARYPDNMRICPMADRRVWLARTRIAPDGECACDGILRAAIRDQVGSIVKRLHKESAVENIGAGRASTSIS